MIKKQQFSWATLRRSLLAIAALAVLLIVMGSLPDGPPVVSAQANSPATGAPVITGTVQATETLVADTSGIADGDGMVNATFAYQWVSNDGSTDTDLADATDSTYTVRRWELGKYIKVRVSFTDDAGTRETLTSAPTTAVETSPNIAPTGSPKFKGMAEVGQSLVYWSFSLPGILDENGTTYALHSHKYQWVRNDGTNDTDIPGATDQDYRLTDADQGKTVKVRVSYIDDGGNREEVTSDPTPTVAAMPSRSDLGAPMALWTRASVPGEEKGNVIEWLAPEGTITGYQILRAESPGGVISGDGPPYSCLPLDVLHVNDTGSDATKYIDTDVAEGGEYSYRVRAINAGGVGRESYGRKVQYTPHGWWPNGVPHAPGNAPRNLTSTRANGGVWLTWDPPLRETWETGGEVTGYQILRSLPEECDFGFRVLVENTNSTRTNWFDTDVTPGTLHQYWVKAVNENGTGPLRSLQYTSIRPERQVGTGTPNSPATGAPTISGTPQVGETLTWGSSGIADEDGLSGVRYSIQWLSGENTEIEGAIGPTYTLNSTDQGKTIKVRVSFADDNFNEEVLTSSATTEVAAADEATQTDSEDTAAPQRPFALWSHWSVRGEPNGIVLHWSAPEGTVTGYQILRQEDPSLAAGTWGYGCTIQMEVYVEDTGSDATTYTDTGVVEGVTYTYHVKAINSNGVGPRSYKTTLQYRPYGWPHGIQGSPRAPQNLEGSTLHVGTELQGIELTWDAPIGDVTGYQILRSRPEECEYGYPVFVENTNSTDTRWTDTDVEIGTLYEYSVRAINDVGAGELDRWDSARVRPRTVIATPNLPRMSITYQSGDNSIWIRESLIVTIYNLTMDDDPDTVDYTLRGDVTLSADGSDTNDCEQGPGLGRDLEFTVIDEVAEQFGTIIGGDGCSTGDYTLTFVLRDRDGQEVRTYTSFVWITGAEDFPATGFPTVTGSAQVTETLTADTSGIADENGLDNVTYLFQWIRSDGTTDTDFGWATSATYLVTAEDVGKTIRVRVYFTDDAGNEVTRTSQATAAVAATVPGVPLSLGVERGGTGELDVSWQAPTSDGGAEISEYTVQWKESTGDWDTAVDVSEATTTDTSYTITGLRLQVEYAVRVIASNSAGDGPASAEATATADAQTSQQQPASENTPATGAPSIIGTLEVGQPLNVDTSSIADEDGLDNVSYAYQWLADDAAIGGATVSSYTLTDSEQGKAIRVQVTFSDDASNTESLTSLATAAVAAPLTAEFLGPPSSHDGQTAFTFELRFSETPISDFSYKTLRDHAFAVTGGSVTNARRLDPPGNVRWEITVEPSSDDDVSIVLPATTECADQGAICTGDDRMLSAEISLTVAGPVKEEQQTPPENNPATGVPTINGTAQVGETLTVNTSGIADTDGLANATFSYQWLVDDVDLVGATGASYTLTDSDEGKAIKVRASFTDDAGNAETLTSEATVLVEAAAEEVVWESELTVGRVPNVFPDALGYPVSEDHGGSLSPDHFEIDGTVFNVEFLLHFAEGLWLGFDQELPVEFTLSVGETSYEGSESKVPVTGSGSGGYWWPSSISEWSEGQSVQVSLSIQSQERIGSRQQAPLTAYVLDIPSAHDGQGTFTFELRFSEEPDPDFSYKTLRDSAFTVTGGEVEIARRLNKPSNIRWEITVKPDGNGEVTIILPATTDCEAEGAVCTGDGRKLSNRLEFTVSGPSG